MAENAKPKPWHVCRDCLDPIADGLQEIGANLHRSYNFSVADALRCEERELHESAPGYDVKRLKPSQQKRMAEIEAELAKRPEPVQPDDIRRLYENHHLDFAVTYLKITISVEFARDLENSLQAPYQKFAALDHRARDILTGGGNTWFRHATRRLIDKHHELSREQFPDLENQPENEELPADLRAVQEEIVEPFSGLGWEILRAAKYVRHSSVVLKAKLERREPNHDELPPESLGDTERYVLMAAQADEYQTGARIVERATNGSADSGHMRNMLSSLKRRGLLESPPNNRGYRTSDKGRNALNNVSTL